MKLAMPDAPASISVSSLSSVGMRHLSSELEEEETEVEMKKEELFIERAG